MNVLGCNDQFFNIFLNILAFIVSFIIAFLNNEVPGKMGLNYYMCTGEDPRDFKDLGSKVAVFLIIKQMQWFESLAAKVLTTDLCSLPIIPIKMFIIYLPIYLFYGTHWFVCNKKATLVVNCSALQT